MKKILIIDDDMDMVDAIRIVLEGHNFLVAAYNDIENAVERIKSESPDLLILDVMFPENVSGGFEIARKIRKENSLKKLPVIIFSAVNEQFKLGFMKFTQDNISEDFMPVNDFLEKPLNSDVLLEKVNHFLKIA